MNSQENIAQQDAWNAVDAVRSALIDAGETAAVAVADSSGELLAFLRLDGCRLSASTIAINKAFTAAREWESTRETGSSLMSGCLLPAMGDGRYTTFAGGLPIVPAQSTNVVGGIGVSGIYDDCSDEWFANVGLEAIGARSQLPEGYKKELGLEVGLVRSIFSRCAQYLATQGQLMSNERILDVGCGSGIVARTALQCQPQLKEAKGFDFDVDAVEVAKRQTLPEQSAKLKFELGDAMEQASYQPGLWDVLFGQHVIPEVPGCAPVMRGALRPGGRALICTWPEKLADCQAYDFLYAAAQQREEKAKNYGGWPLEGLVKVFENAGFEDVIPLEGTDRLATPRITPQALLRQYLDGSAYGSSRPYEEKTCLFDSKRLYDLAKDVTHTNPDVEGKFEFRIKINAILAKAP